MFQRLCQLAGFKVDHPEPVVHSRFVLVVFGHRQILVQMDDRGLILLRFSVLVELVDTDTEVRDWEG